MKIIDINDETLQKKMREAYNKEKQKILAEKRDINIPDIKLSYSGYVTYVYGENEELDKFCSFIRKEF